MGAGILTSCEFLADSLGGSPSVSRPDLTHEVVHDPPCFPTVGDREILLYILIQDASELPDALLLFIGRRIFPGHFLTLTYD